MNEMGPSKLTTPWPSRRRGGSYISSACASAATSWCAKLMLDDPAPFVPVTMSKCGKQADLEAKTVMLAGRRYIVCHQEAEKDAADRAAILAALERQLAKGEKALVGNTGFRRYPRSVQRGSEPPAAPIHRGSRLRPDIEHTLVTPGP